VEVIGVSGDSVKGQSVFKQSHNLNFTLLADETGAVAKKFGVPFGKGGTITVKDANGNPVTMTRGVTIQRWTFVIGKDGKIAYKNDKVMVADDAKKVLEVVEKLGK
jgi:peroxiredoxin Q/BCP